MADHESVQQAETAAAGKVSELSEAMIRVLLQQRAEQAKDRTSKARSAASDLCPVSRGCSAV